MVTVGFPPCCGLNRPLTSPRLYQTLKMETFLGKITVKVEKLIVFSVCIQNLLRNANCHNFDKWFPLSRRTFSVLKFNLVLIFYWNLSQQTAVVVQVLGLLELTVFK